MVYQQKTFGKQSFLDFCFRYSTEEEIKKYLPKSIWTKRFDDISATISKFINVDNVWPQDEIIEYIDRIDGHILCTEKRSVEASMDSREWILVSLSDVFICDKDGKRKKYLKTIFKKYVDEIKLYERNNINTLHAAIDLYVYVYTDVIDIEEVCIVKTVIKNMSDEIVKISKESIRNYISVDYRKYFHDRMFSNYHPKHIRIFPLQSIELKETYKLKEIGRIFPGWELYFNFQDINEKLDYHYEYVIDEIEKETRFIFPDLKKYNISKVPRKTVNILKHEKQKVVRDEDKEKSLGFVIEHLTVTEEKEYEEKLFILGEIIPYQKHKIPIMISIIFTLLDRDGDMIDYNQIDIRKEDVLKTMPFKCEFRGIDNKNIGTIKVSYRSYEKIVNGIQ